jgi:hypothetical protein
MLAFKMHNPHNLAQKDDQFQSLFQVSIPAFTQTAMILIFAN